MCENFVRPVIYISRCITFEPVRYNGGIVKSDFVSRLKPFIDPITHCPEVEIGLGIPRKRLRLISKDNQTKKPRLIQPETGFDFTEKMLIWTKKILDELPEIDGFILKSQSPSSGVYDVKIYTEKGNVITSRGSGLFGGAIIKNFTGYPIEDDGRLKNESIADNFLRRIFAMAGFRHAKKQKKISVLMDFHAKNKFLFMSYNQKLTREMGKILADSKISFEDKINAYFDNMKLCLGKMYKPSNVINVFEHSLGYFSKKLSANEKKYFLNTLKKYEQGKTSINIPLSLMKSYIVRFGEPYLEKQSFFNPYPEEIMNGDF